MALVWLDGFEDGMNSESYYYNFFSYGSGGRGTGNSIYINVSGDGFKYRIPSPQASIGIAFAFKRDGLGSGFVTFLRIGGDTGATAHIEVFINSAGALEFRRATSGTVLLTTAALLPTVNVWYHIEMFLVLSDTVGEVRCWVDGTNAGSATGLDTKNGGTVAAFDDIFFRNPGPYYPYFDDFFVYDTTGTYNNTYPIGNCVIEHLRPNADTATVQWTPSTGTSHFACVDDVGPGYSDYVSSNTVGQRDLYELTPSTGTASDLVLGVMTWLVADKDLIGARQIAPVLRDTTGTRVGSNGLLVQSTHTMFKQTYDRRSDGTPFTIAELATLGAGVDVTV